MVMNRGKMKRKRKDDASSLILDYSPKRTKVHAQRKFAQGSNVNSPVMTPVKELERQEIDVMPEPVELLPIRRPNTEDFLTFLCFRGTPILPPSLNFFNTASIVDTNGQVHEIKSESPKNGPIDTCAITKTGCGSSERPFVAFGVRKRADPIVISRQMDRKRRHALALQALRRKYQEQRMAKIRAVTISKLSEKVTNKVLVRTNTVKTETITKKTNVLHKTKVVATKHVKVTTQTVKTLRPPNVKPKMCLRSFRGRFVQKELKSRKNAAAAKKLKPIKNVVVAVRKGKARGAKKQEAVTAAKSDSSENDDVDDDDDDDDDVPLVKTTPKPKVKVAPKVAKKTVVIGPKKPSEVNFRITRSNKFPNPKMTSRRQQIKQRMILTAPNTIVKRRTLRSHTTATQKSDGDNKPPEQKFKSSTPSKKDRKKEPPEKKTKDVPLKKDSAAKPATSTTTKKETTKTEIMKRVLNKTIETSKNMVAKMPKPVVALRKTTINVIEHLKKKELERIKLDIRKAPPSTSSASTSRAEETKVKKTKCKDAATPKPGISKPKDVTLKPKDAAAKQLKDDTPKLKDNTLKLKDAATKLKDTTPKLKDGAVSKSKDGASKPKEAKHKDVVNVKKSEEPKEEEPRASRPSRKTKEAAAIYMEILSHKLVNESRIDDDNVSIDSFPELPNVKKTEQRENELKAQAQDTKDKDQKKKNPQQQQSTKDQRDAATKKKADVSKKTEDKKGEQDSRALRSGDKPSKSVEEKKTNEEKKLKSIESKKVKNLEEDKVKLKEKSKAEEEKKAKAEEEKKLKAEEEKKFKAEEEKRADEEKRIRAEEEKRHKAEEEKKMKAEEEKIRKAEEEKRKKAEEEKRKKAEEENRMKAEEEKRIKAEEEERVKAEEEKRMKAEEEKRVRAEEEKRRKIEEEKKIKAEEEKKRKAEEEKKRKAEEEKIRKAEEEKRLKAEEEKRVRAEEEKRVKAEEEKRMKAEEEKRVRAEEEKRRKIEEEKKIKAEEEKKRKAEEEKKMKAEEEKRRKIEEAKKIKAEEERRVKAEEERRVKAVEEKRVKAEEEERVKAEEEKKVKAEEEKKVKAEEEKKAKAEKEKAPKNEESNISKTIVIDGKTYIEESKKTKIEEQTQAMEVVKTRYSFELIEMKPVTNVNIRPKTASSETQTSKRKLYESEMKMKRGKMEDAIKQQKKKIRADAVEKTTSASANDAEEKKQTEENQSKKDKVGGGGDGVKLSDQKAKVKNTASCSKTEDNVIAKQVLLGSNKEIGGVVSLANPHGDGGEMKSAETAGNVEKAKTTTHLEKSTEDTGKIVDNLDKVEAGTAEKKKQNTKRGKVDDKKQARNSSNTAKDDSDSDESFHVDVVVPRRKQATRSKPVKSYASEFDDDSIDSPKTDEIIEEIKKALKKDAAALKNPPPKSQPAIAKESCSDSEKSKPKPKKKLTKTRSIAKTGSKQNAHFSDSDEEPLIKLKADVKPKRECAKRPQNYLPMFSSSEDDDEIYYRVEEAKQAEAKEKKQQQLPKVTAAIAATTPKNEETWDLSCKDIGRRFGKGKVNMSNEQIEKWIKDSAMAGFNKNESDDMLTDKIPTDTSLVAGSSIDTQKLKKSLLLMAEAAKVEIKKDAAAAKEKNQPKAVAAAAAAASSAGPSERKIFRKEKLSSISPSTNAFSANNESSVYAFEEPHEDVMKTPFRRPTRRPSSTATSKSEDEKPEETKGHFRKPSLLRQDSTKSTSEEPAEDKPGPSTPSKLMEPPSNAPQKPYKDFKSKAKSDRLSEASEEFKYKIPSSPSASSSSSAKLCANKRQNPKQIKCRAAEVVPVKLAEFPCFGQGQLVEAPTFHPSDKEFQDPIEYIEKIRARAEQFGICRIIPPATFKPECKVTDDMRFTAYNQYVHKMLHRWGPNFKELMAIKKYLSTQNISLTQSPWIGGMEIDLPRLYQTVQMLGGLKEVIEKKKWSKVSDAMKIPKSAQDRVTKLDDIYCKYLLPYDTLSPAEREKLFDEVETDWAKRESKSLLKAQQNVEESDNDEDSEDDREAEECIVKGRNMALNAFYRIARNTMSMWFRNPEPSAQEVEQEFWKHVTQKQNHICVHSGSIDSGSWGYGFAVSKNSPFARHAWNLKVLTNNSGSVLRSLGPMMGVTVPTLHVGMVFSSCCWYRDPHGLPWIEYLHTGGNKIWYGIPDSTSASFHAALKRTVPNYCRNKTIWLPSDTVMVPPNLLVENGVSLSRVAQEPGQFVVVFPKVYTSCLSTGYVVSESVYFAPPAWLRSAKVLFDELRDSSEPSMFSLERLLLSIVNDQRSNVEVLRQVTPAIQALCDIEKSNREKLKAMGVCAEEKLPLPEAPSGKKKRKLHEDDGDYECELCRMSLFVSMVTESQEDGVYCLDHAIEQIEKNKIQSSLCKLLYTYDVKDLDGLQDKIKTAIENKLQKKIPGKFAGMPTLLNK